MTLDVDDKDAETVAEQVVTQHGAQSQSHAKVSLEYQREWERHLERRLERRIGSVGLWRCLAIIFAALCMLCMWLMAGVIIKGGFRISWLGF